MLTRIRSEVKSWALPAYLERYEHEYCVWSKSSLESNDEQLLPSGLFGSTEEERPCRGFDHEAQMWISILVPVSTTV
jgi:hypothetical protein